MKPTVNYQCDCLERAYANLSLENTTFDTIFALDNKQIYLQIAVCKIDTYKRGKPLKMIIGQNFCPFCGEKTIN